MSFSQASATFDDDGGVGGGSGGDDGSVGGGSGGDGDGGGGISGDYGGIGVGGDAATSAVAAAAAATAAGVIEFFFVGRAGAARWPALISAHVTKPYAAFIRCQLSGLGDQPPSA